MSLEFNDDDLPLHSRLAERLNELGWRSSCDAQHTNLRDALPAIREMLNPPVNDGGPAYPTAETIDYPSCSVTEYHAGMSLRDHFAGAALKLLPAWTWRDIGFKPVDGLSIMENNALCAYQQADAMLKARAS